MSAARAPRVVADADALALAAADAVVAQAATAIRARGAFRFAVPGGRTPRGMLASLAATDRADAPDWTRVTVLLADERALPSGDPERNDWLVRETLLAPLGGRAPRFVPMRAEDADLERAAQDYASELAVPLDLVVLGVGEDGHVASLFPGSPLFSDAARLVAVVRDSPKPPPVRLTLAPRALAEARAVLVLASGSGKADAVAAALAPGADPRHVPAALRADAAWIVDRDAAARLGRGTRP